MMVANTELDVSLEEYDSLHRMVATPGIAKKCIKSWNDGRGCILFMPSDVSNDELFLFDASHENSLNLLSYYALVIFSLTGLSTILGMTDTVDVQDFSKVSGTSDNNSNSNSKGVTVWPPKECSGDDSDSTQLLTRSMLDPKVYARDSVFEYVQRHAEMYNQKIPHEKDTPTVLRVQRRFEYKFRLCGGLSVIMLHVRSSTCPDVLHLVEVYRFNNPLFRFISKWVFHTISKIFVHTHDKKRKRV